MNVDDGQVFDVAIAGGGPAGSSAAIRLARAGLRVVLIEQKSFPRNKLCGEFISPECLAHFEELGVEPPAGGSSIERTTFFARSGRELTMPVSWFAAGQRAIGLSRSAMDKALIDRARDVGVDVREATVVKSAMLTDGRATGLLTRSAADELAVNATLAIDARGRTRGLVDEANTTRRAARHVAFKVHLGGVSISQRTCEMFVYRGGYGGCLPIENGLHNLCFIAPAAAVIDCGSDPERYMRTVLMTNRRAAAVLRDARAVDDWLAVPVDGLGRRNPVPAPGLLAVGDAAAFIDPFTGSGILLALQSGDLAAKTIIENFPNVDGVERDYRRRYMKQFARRFRASAFLRYAFRAPAFAEIALTVLGSSEQVLRRLAVATRSEKAAGA